MAVLTVADLIAALTGLPPDLEVLYERVNEIRGVGVINEGAGITYVNLSQTEEKES